MGASFLITLREGLEISLVLAILAGYLVKSGRSSDLRSMWKGAFAALALCLIFGVAIHLAVGGLNGKVEQATEAVIAVSAASVLTWMIFWMRENARNLGTQLRTQVDQATGAKALAAIAFVAVFREGLETALFLLGAETSSASGAKVVVGGLIGLAISGVLGYLVYKGGNRLNLRKFFLVTGVMLIFFAAGLVGKAFHESRELFGFESGWLIDPAWTVTSGPWSEGTLFDFMKGLFGWSSDAERIRVLTYFLYIIPIMAVFVRGPRKKIAT
ncbi:MAG: FTR1 family protein [Actinomycetes bacterium]